MTKTTRRRTKKIGQQLLDDGFYDGQSSFECGTCGNTWGGYLPSSKFVNYSEYQKYASGIKDELERKHEC